MQERKGDRQYCKSLLQYRSLSSVKTHNEIYNCPLLIKVYLFRFVIQAHVSVYLTFNSSAQPNGFKLCRGGH
jgi:hypothetical protein